MPFFVSPPMSASAVSSPYSLKLELNVLSDWVPLKYELPKSIIFFKVLPHFSQEKVTFSSYLCSSSVFIPQASHLY